MKRPVRSARFLSVSAGPARGYTLVEILVATVLTLIMVVAVVQIFGDIGQSVSDSRATLEMSDRLRAARTRLEMDLAGATATTLPPLRPENGKGYFEYIEGLVGVVPGAQPEAVDSDNANAPDTTVGDIDDILMFTTQSSARPFVGRCAVTGGTIEADVAEVAWFLRGRTLYRRVMLVTPSIALPAGSSAGFFANNDLSVRWEGGNLVANSLGDLTKRECRYAHWWNAAVFPYDARLWGRLGLPTLRECSSASWIAGNMPPQNVPEEPTDFWNDPTPWPAEVDPVTGTLNPYLDGPRMAEDVILTNVIGFDVKAWDPGAPVRSDGNVALGPSDPGYQALVSNSAPVVSYGAYVDLNYNYGGSSDLSAFAGPGNAKAGLARVYDTWSFHYEHDGVDQFGDGNVDMATNGFDDNDNGIVDDPAEMETSPPYPVPLRAIQIKIRVFEPDSRQIREVTVVHDFLPK
jgi:type II secretory pathway component PulJ